MFACNYRQEELRAEEEQRQARSKKQRDGSDTGAGYEVSTAIMAARQLFAARLSRLASSLAAALQGAGIGCPLLPIFDAETPERVTAFTMLLFNTGEVWHHLSAGSEHLGNAASSSVSLQALFELGASVTTISPRAAAIVEAWLRDAATSINPLSSHLSAKGGEALNRVLWSLAYAWTEGADKPWVAILDPNEGELALCTVCKYQTCL